MAKVSNLTMKVQNGTDRTMFTTWKWTKDNTDHYSVKWEYDTGNNVWFPASSGDETKKESLYNASTNAKRVRFKVKPIAKTHTVNKKEVAYWTAEWSAWKVFTYTITAPKKAGKPFNVNVDERTNDSDGSLYATWDWKQDHVDHYQTVWQCKSKDGVWFTESDSTTTSKNSTFSIPDWATHVRFKVKAFAKTHKVYGIDTKYWNGDWSTYVTHDVKEFEEPTDAPVPTVKIENTTLTAEIDTYDAVANYYEFQVIKNDSSTVDKGTGKKVTNHVSFVSKKVQPSNEYKVRCRGIKATVKKGKKVADPNNLMSAPAGYVDKVYGPWSEYSESIGTQPAKPKKITWIKAKTPTSIALAIDPVNSVKTYEVEYTSQKIYFDSSSETKTITVQEPFADITGLDSGQEWFFRARAVNDVGTSPWTDIVSIVIGKKPSPPTTWSERTTTIIGEDVYLYWVHNTEDGSSQVSAEIEITVNDSNRKTITVTNSKDEDKKDLTSEYKLSTSSYTEGCVIKWRVRTKGITNEYSDWSVTRIITVYERVTLSFIEEPTGDYNSFPIPISLHSEPKTQTPLSYSIEIFATESYETLSETGRRKIVNKGERIFYTYEDTPYYTIRVVLDPSNIDLTNNQTYRVVCKVAMDSGMTDTIESEFSVYWEEYFLTPDAEIGYDPDTYTTFIRPYCEDWWGDPVKGIKLSVYRKDYDGTFTELASQLTNEDDIFITDPHPQLNYARYRIVTTYDSTGAVGYYDTPPFYIGESSIIIQWDEEWDNFYGSEEEQPEPFWSGSILKLPYNISTSETSAPDVSLIEYIGRKHPISYYGTQVGQTASWNAVFLREDEDTILALRRLQIYMGDVYVREPSGVGYWANVTVSFNRSYDSQLIPVTLDVKRVEGGA